MKRIDLKLTSGDLTIQASASLSDDARLRIEYDVDLSRMLARAVLGGKAPAGDSGLSEAIGEAGRTLAARMPELLPDALAGRKGLRALPAPPRDPAPVKRGN